MLWEGRLLMMLKIVFLKPNIIFSKAFLCYNSTNENAVIHFSEQFYCKTQSFADGLFEVPQISLNHVRSKFSSMWTKSILRKKLSHYS